VICLDSRFRFTVFVTAEDVSSLDGVSVFNGRTILVLRLLDSTSLKIPFYVECALTMLRQDVLDWYFNCLRVS
jgi:hypothetical protein